MLGFCLCEASSLKVSNVWERAATKLFMTYNCGGTVLKKTKHTKHFRISFKYYRFNSTFIKGIVFNLLIKIKVQISEAERLQIGK